MAYGNSNGVGAYGGGPNTPGASGILPPGSNYGGGGGSSLEAAAWTAYGIETEYKAAAMVAAAHLSGMKGADQIWMQA